VFFLHKVDPTKLASHEPNKTLIEASPSPNQGYSLLLIAPSFAYRSLSSELRKNCLASCGCNEDKPQATTMITATLYKLISPEFIPIL